MAVAKASAFGEPVASGLGCQAIRTLKGLWTTTMGVIFTRISTHSSSTQTQFFPQRIRFHSNQCILLTLKARVTRCT